MAESAHLLTFEAPKWGWLALVASERGVRLLVLPAPSAKAAEDAALAHYPDAAPAPSDLLLADAGQQVLAYLAGARREFALALDLRGHTSFALAVWAAAVRIPYGATRTYRWVADEMGGGRGVYQAVGVALAANPVPLVIPCHRVIGSDGSLHGYLGGLAMKERLLALESGQESFAWSPRPDR